MGPAPFVIVFNGCNQGAMPGGKQNLRHWQGQVRQCWDSFSPVGHRRPCRVSSSGWRRRSVYSMPMTSGATLTFLGAAGGTVTGSKHLLEHGGRRLLLDCGLFQGLKALRLRNWARPPLDPRALAAVVLSHAHVDHSGYLPRLVRDGFRGPVYCTGGTADLLEILLPDAAHLQEEEASFANRHRTSRHDPALPLFTTA